MFSKDLVAVTTSRIMEAVQWLDKKETLSIELTNNVVAAINEAITTEHVSIICLALGLTLSLSYLLPQVDGVYLCCHGNSTLRAFTQLQDLLQSSPVPVHISVYQCGRRGEMEQYQLLADASHARYMQRALCNGHKSSLIMRNFEKIISYAKS